MYDTHMSTPGITAKLGATHSNIYRQHKEVRPWLGANLQCISQHTTESALYPLCQPGIESINKFQIGNPCKKIISKFAEIRIISYQLEKLKRSTIIIFIIISGVQ